MPRLLLLELNEINFDHLRHYVAAGRLPHLARLIDAHGVAETTSEARYEELEPWIQWVTAHTGLTLAEHGVFRLGDILQTEVPQLWEVLEQQGLRVGAMSPMNANNHCKNAAFFVPDPWTPAPLTAGGVLKRLYGAIAQAVNDNAQARLTPASAAALLMGAARYARPSNYRNYTNLAAAAARGRSWAKAMFLDQLLADVFMVETRRGKPDFASLFLNAGAHIQHHYMFNSPAYQGALKNPEWYVDADYDPVGEVYALYDRIVGQVQAAFPDARLMIATGLHQDPHPELTFYWRLKDHASYLTKLGVPFVGVEPRMSRDFLVACASAEEAAHAQQILESAAAADGGQLFEVDNRGSDLFVMLTWPHDIPNDFAYRVGNALHHGLRDEVAFVAIKNGQHHGHGYFIDTGHEAAATPSAFPLAALPERVCEALGKSWPFPRGASEPARLTIS